MPHIFSAALAALTVTQSVLGLVFQGQHRDVEWIRVTWYGPRTNKKPPKLVILKAGNSFLDPTQGALFPPAATQKLLYCFFGHKFGS